MNAAGYGGLGLAVRARARLAAPSLLGNTAWTFTGNGVYAASQWGMLVALVKLGSPSMVGQFALGLAISAPVILFSNLSLRAVQATDATREYRFPDYLALRLVTTLVAFFVIVIITWSIGYRWDTARVIVAVGVAKAFEALSDVFYGLLQQHERMDRIAKSLIIKGGLSVVALGGVVYVTGSVFCGVVAIAVSWAALLLGYDLRSGVMVLGSQRGGDAVRLACPRFNPATLRRLASLTLPLGFVLSLLSLNSNVPRYFIARYLGERELGVFASIAYVPVVGMTLVTALGDAVSPRLSKYYAARNLPAFRGLLLKLSGVAAVLGAAGILVAAAVGSNLLGILYRPEYARDDIFTWLMVEAAVSYQAAIMGYGVTAARWFKPQLPLALFATVCIGLASLWLIPSHGLRGAATAVIIGACTKAVGGFGILTAAVRARRRAP